MGLTAARFDLLYVLREHLMEMRGPMPQRDVVRELGVTPPVVSRMLKSLRELGLVTRQRDPLDGRAWLVSLTVSGRYAIRDAVDVFITRGRAERHVERGLCPGMPPGADREDTAFVRMTHLEALLDDLRKGWHARGRLYYPWHPDD
jgi:DNA-binding MarR family transcriptional regulator